VAGAERRARERPVLAKEALAPMLENSRHERFAQGLASGLTQLQAYAEAGYCGNHAHASRLSKNPRVRARVAEIMERAAARAEISVAMVTESLIRLAGKAENAGAAPGLAVARAAWMDAAKLNGLVVDRSEVAEESVRRIISDRPQTEEEWAKRHGAGEPDAGPLSQP
jgi:phage terminase small subunit